MCFQQRTWPRLLVAWLFLLEVLMLISNKSMRRMVNYGIALYNTIGTGKTKRLEFMQIKQSLLKTSQEAPDWKGVLTIRNIHALDSKGTIWIKMNLVPGSKSKRQNQVIQQSSSQPITMLTPKCCGGRKNSLKPASQYNALGVKARRNGGTRSCS